MADAKPIPIDPTKNVEDLVKALEVTLEKLRVSDARYQDAMREAGEKLQSTRSAAESKRVDQLAELRQTYETRIADMLRTSVESTSTLVSTQLVQIQNTFNERVAKLEQFRYESVGKTSVSDPALAEAIAQIARAQAQLAATVAGLKVGEGRTEGKDTGQAKLAGMIFSAIVVGGVMFSIIEKLFHP